MRWTANFKHALQTVTQKLRNQPFLREFISFGGSTLFEQGSRLITNLVAAALLGPAVWGSWFALNLILSYGALVHLGAMNGMNRAVPLALGRDDVQSAARLSSSALGFLLWVYPLAIFIGYFLLSGAIPTINPAHLALTLGLLAAQELYGYTFTSLRANLEFSKVTRIQALRAITLPLVAVPLMLSWQLSGFIFSLILMNLLGVYLATRYASVPFRPRLHWPTIQSLIVVGFPMMLVGFVLSITTTVDRWVVMLFLDEVALGHYSLSILSLGAFGILPKVLAQQLYPRMVKDWAKNHALDRLYQLARRQRTLTLLIMTPISIGGLLLAEPLITRFLPDYQGGIHALQLSLLAPILQSLAVGYGNIFNVIDRQMTYLRVALIAAAANLATSILLIREYGITGVAAGTLIGFAVLATLVYIASRGNGSSVSGSQPL